MAKDRPRFVGPVVVVAAVALVIVGAVLRRFSPARASRNAAALTLPAAPLQPPFQLVDVGPRLISNQTTTPVLVMGQGLTQGDVLVLGAPANREVVLAAADGQRGWARLPGIDLPAAQSEADVKVTLRRATGALALGDARLTIANDLHFPDPVGLAVTGGLACAISTPTDELVCVTAPGKPQRRQLGDGPSAIVAAGPSARLLIGYEYLPELWLLTVPGLAVQKLPGPRAVTGMAFDASRAIAFVAEHQGNSLQAIDVGHGGAVLWRTPIDPGPGRVALAGDVVAVGSKQTGEVQLVSAADGALVATLSPSPGMPIVGGHTAAFSGRIDGGLAVRDLVYSKQRGLLFVASAGPNIGPNPERMEVAMNGGVTVIDVKKRAVLYHLGFGAGVSEALALEDARGVLYVSDIGLGLVRAVDVEKLARGPAAAVKALQSSVAIPPPDGFPSIRPAAELGVQGRAGPELHSGPKALALDGHGALFALDRLSGTLARFQTSPFKLVEQTPLFDVLEQPQRRAGQIVYYTDVGRTGMSCDTCHVDGHVGGLLFSKTRPIRLYRATSIRGSRETPPYFIPASEQSLLGTASFVGDRNRYQNPPLNPSEIAALALFTSEIPTPPNPFVAADGAPPASLTLPDGAVGNPRAGVDLFFGKARCQGCHPGPLFTTDQSPTTRGRYLAVGMPAHFPLRPQFQDGVKPEAPAQSLNGLWDLFPLTTTGVAGFSAKDDKLVVGSRFPLRALLERRGDIPHGNLAVLSPGELNDLLAFLLTL